MREGPALLASAARWGPLLLTRAGLAAVLAGWAPAVGAGPQSQTGPGRFAGPATLGAQEVQAQAFSPPRLRASLEQAADHVVLRLDVPEGWALYAPAPGTPGLPLRVSWAGDGVALPLAPSWPPDEPYPTNQGAARVFRGSVTARLPAEALPPGVETLAASVRWAVCRPDLCVPGRSEVEVRLRR